jgi:hypothetical protein
MVDPDLMAALLAHLDELARIGTPSVGDALARSAEDVRALAVLLSHAAEPRLRASSVDAIDLGVHQARASIALEVTAELLVLASAASAPAPRHGLLALVRAILADALHLLSAAALIDDTVAPPLFAGGLPSSRPECGSSRPERAPPASTPDLLHEIAVHHREHERFYAQQMADSASELLRVANRLRVLANTWSLPPPGEPLARSCAAPEHQAAGCRDLNAWAAIPVIGVLFMEGEQVPAELHGLLAKLHAHAEALERSGRWLAEKMHAAWSREKTALSAELAEVAPARFFTVVTNWRGAREQRLTGRLLARARELLQALDLTPRGLRADRAGSARALDEIAGVIALAAQLSARGGANLADNDRRWTRYLDTLRAA